MSEFSLTDGDGAKVGVWAGQDGVARIKVKDFASEVHMTALLGEDDVPRLAFELLTRTHRVQTDPQISAAAKALQAFLWGREKVKLRQRQDALTLELFDDCVYDQVDSRARAAVDRIIELEDKLLEAAP